MTQFFAHSSFFMKMVFECFPIWLHLIYKNKILHTYHNYKEYPSK